MINISYLLNNEKEKICVETYTPKAFNSTIIFCHGITGCRKGRTINDNYFQQLAKKLMDAENKVVLFDFSGHGESEGFDYDVCLTKSTQELEKVFFHEVQNVNKVKFLAFSYGAAVLTNFLSNHKEIVPEKIVMYSPCIYPLESCFLNKNSIFGKDVVKELNDGKIDDCGYAVVGAKGFRLGAKILEECKTFSPEYLSNFNDTTLFISGNNDVILDTKYNENFAKKHNIKNIYLEASHSLFEQIEKAFELTIDFFCK